MCQKFTLCLAFLCLMGSLAGCQKSASSAPDSLSSQVPETGMLTETQPAIPHSICYLEGHGTTDPSELTGWIDSLEADGYQWNVSGFDTIPTDTDVVILCAPREDITSDELGVLDQYLDDGGRILFLMPPDEEAVRYKYLERLLAEFCIEMDYNRISETNEFMTYDKDPNWIGTTMVSYPTTMQLESEEASEEITYFKEVRSFHITCLENFNALRMDTILATSDTVIGTPFGGVEEDPITYEETSLGVMLYCYDDTRNTSAIVTVGSASFLTDDAFDSEASASAAAWVSRCIAWLVM